VWEILANPTRRPQTSHNGGFHTSGCHAEICSVASSLATTTPFTEEEILNVCLAAYQTPPGSPNPCGREEIAGCVRDAFRKFRNGEGLTEGERGPGATRKKPSTVISKSEINPEVLARWEANATSACGSTLGVTEMDLREASPIRPPEGGGWDDFHCVVTHLYQPEEFVNVATRWGKDTAGRITPKGAGTTRRAKDWARTVPHVSEVGGWMMPNPAKAAQGSGLGGAICNVDIADCRFLLCEADNLPAEKQLAFWAASKLPVAALIYSGKRSYHAWIRLDSPDLDTHKAHVEEVTTILWNCFGFDRVKDIRRLSRLPGATRRLGLDKPTRQSLLYLNPQPTPGKSIL